VGEIENRRGDGAHGPGKSRKRYPPPERRRPLPYPGEPVFHGMPNPLLQGRKQRPSFHPDQGPQIINRGDPTPRINLVGCGCRPTNPLEREPETLFNRELRCPPPSLLPTLPTIWRDLKHTELELYAGRLGPPCASPGPARALPDEFFHCTPNPPGEGFPLRPRPAQRGPTDRGKNRRRSHPDRSFQTTPLVPATVPPFPTERPGSLVPPSAYPLVSCAIPTTCPWSTGGGGPDLTHHRDDPSTR